MLKLWRKDRTRNTERVKMFLKLNIRNKIGFNLKWVKNISKELRSWIIYTCSAAGY